MLFLYQIHDRFWGFTVCAVSAPNEEEAREILNAEHPSALMSMVDLVDQGEQTVSLEFDE